MAVESASEAVCDSETESAKLVASDSDATLEDDSDASTLPLYEFKTEVDRSSEAVPEATADSLALSLCESRFELLALTLSDADALCDTEFPEEILVLLSFDILTDRLADTEAASDVNAESDRADKLSFLLFNDAFASSDSVDKLSSTTEYDVEADADSDAKLSMTLVACES
jgi:hypothetical protein